MTDHPSHNPIEPSKQPVQHGHSGTQDNMQDQLQDNMQDNLQDSPVFTRLNEQDAAAIDALFDGTSAADAYANASTPERLKQVKAVSALLHAWQVPPVPLDLMNRTLAMVNQAHEQAKVRTEPLKFSFAPGRLTEVAAMVAVVLIAFSLAVPMLTRARDNERKLLCQSNLAQAGSAINAYGQDYQGELMRGQTNPNDAWWRVGQAAKKGQAVQSNSAHLYLLPRNGYINPNTLACPDNEHAPRNMSANANDWAAAQNVSYSYQNQYTAKPYKTSQSPGMAVLADKNPLFNIHSRDGMTYRRDLSPNSASRFHRSNGQNVLTASGNVAWQTDPNMSRGHGNIDNIWLLNKVSDYQGNERPADNNDSFLVP